ncbi:MAG: hypothetical protein ACKVWR_07730 [Acidimicrobiales bacterium]
MSSAERCERIVSLIDESLDAYQRWAAAFALRLAATPSGDDPRPEPAAEAA